MNRQNRSFRSGLTLIEMTVAGVASLIVIMAVGMLMDGASRAWLAAFEVAHGQEYRDAQTVRATFTSFGRRANRGSYVLYEIKGNTFTPVQASPAVSQSVVYGDAVEFRYWDVPLDVSDTHAIMDTSRIATAYALFYLDGGQLKVDYGSYPPRAISQNSGHRNTAGVVTAVLADNVTADPDTGPFSYTANAGVGRGCIRLKATLTDPDTGETTSVVAGTLLRNIWPR